MAHPTHGVSPGVGGAAQLGPHTPGVASCLEICEGVPWQNSSPVNASEESVLKGNYDDVSLPCTVQLAACCAVHGWDGVEQPQPTPALHGLPPGLPPDRHTVQLLNSCHSPAKPQLKLK